MFMFQERITLQGWKPYRVAFMTYVFSDLITSEYKNFLNGIKKYKMNPLLLEYSKGELLSHGRTQKLWNVDVDRMYVHVWVNCNHWITLCISLVNMHIKVFDCGDQEVEEFTILVLCIVKVVQSLRMQKYLTITLYIVSYVPMHGLNRGGCHCGVYTLKHIECHLLGLDLSLMDDDNIKGARIKIMRDLLEASTDPELIERMSKYEPPTYKDSKYIEF
ncbi:hypothetical protein N665_0179s0011 [Sinapis alba]|nr:hypothetical protein N665_0179s0011 [Sinapis alba]